MWRASLHSSDAMGSESEPSLPEFDAIIATPQRTIEGLRRHIRCLVGAVNKESTLVAVIQFLEAERQGLSDPSTTAEIRSGENNIPSSASSAVAKLSLNCESHPHSVNGFTTTPANSKFNSVNPAERPDATAATARRGRRAAAENVDIAANRVEEDEMEGAITKTAAPEGPFSSSPQPSSLICGRESQVSHGRRAAVSAESLPLNAIQGYRPPVVPKSPEEECVARAGVMACHLFSNMDIKDQTVIVHALRRETFPAGTDILKQDGPSVEKLFLLTRGSCDVIKNGKVVHTLLEGSTFGEMEMMYNLPTCVATVRSVTNCVLYTLDQFTYQHIVLAVSLHKRTKYEALLRNVKFLSTFSNYDRMQIAEAIVTKTYCQDDYIIRFGEAGRWLHLIVEGEVAVVGRDRGKKREILRLYEGDVIGELEFLFNELAVADVIATSRRVTTAQIKRKHFEF
ncbi:protein kinase [Trypanosoma rangeli SC58]|uniref:Protein kinase n=1 Tax=Trypanosoma rangeli SC58 TaxID=429131 RepID=A0A061J6S4_TRYRA|nr:protein kinase [Trypanosoma rangeli SC58]